MVWYGVDEETPLDTMGQANLWLWDGFQVLRGGYGQTLESSRPEWFDHNGNHHIISWRAIMAWELYSDRNAEPEQPLVLPIYKRNTGR